MNKRLTKGEKKIFGVCSGLADYFEMDPSIVRLIFLVMLLVFGTGVLLYLILAIILPEKSVT
jgi:phage shock protein C